MFDAFRRAQRVVSLAGRVPLLREPAEEWLIALRWVAIAGMIMTVAIAGQLVPGLRLLPLFAILTLIALLNLTWMIFTSRARSLVVPQLAIDVLTLGSLLWFSGGIANPFAGFLTFQIALAGLLTRGSTTAGIAALVVLASLVLFFAPPLPWRTSVVAPDALRQAAYLACVTGLGAFMGFAAYVYDARVEALQAERARDERLAMAGRLAGSMAHELNTPLATILLASNELIAVAAEVKGAHAGDEVTLLARTVAQQAQRASDIIELLRGRVRDGGALAKMGMVDLSALVKEVFDEELNRLHFSGERLVRAGGSIHAYGSVAALRQIFANVAKNAVEAMTTGSPRRIEVTVEEQEARVLVRVIDSGSGIPSADLARLGEPFQTTKEVSGGMGLGLYVCAMLAEQMGAQLQIESREGEETCVTLALRKDAIGESDRTVRDGG